MKTIIVLLICIGSKASTYGQKPASGTYTYRLCYTEWSGCYNTCTVIIKDDSIIIYANEDLSVPKGEVIDKGLILQHTSGKWIIAQKPQDKNAIKIGGCRSGLPIIDFKRKRYRSC